MAQSYPSKTVAPGVHLFGPHREPFWLGNYQSLKKRLAAAVEAMVDKSTSAYADAGRFVAMIDLDRDQYSTMPAAEMPYWLVNMPVLELPRSIGGLLVYSPVPLDQAGLLRAALDALGPVRVVISPHAFHTAGLASFRRAYPKAVFVCPKGTQLTGGKSLAELRPDLEFRIVIENPSPDASEAMLIELLGDGVRLDLMIDAVLNEVVIYHEASKTLINADFVYKAPGFEATPGVGGPEQQYMGPLWFCRAYQSLFLDTSPSGLLPDNRAFLATHRMFDRESFLASLDRIQALDLDQLICTHCDPMRGEKANMAVQETWGWLQQL